MREVFGDASGANRRGVVDVCWDDLRFVPVAACVFVLRERGVRAETFLAGVSKGWDGEARKTAASEFSGVIGRG